MTAWSVDPVAWPPARTLLTVLTYKVRVRTVLASQGCDEGQMQKYFSTSCSHSGVGRCVCERHENKMFVEQAVTCNAMSEKNVRKPNGRRRGMGGQEKQPQAQRREERLPNPREPVGRHCSRRYHTQRAFERKIILKLFFNDGKRSLLIILIYCLPSKVGVQFLVFSGVCVNFLMNILGRMVIYFSRDLRKKT